MARSKVGRGNYIIVSILAVVGFFLGLGGWGVMVDSSTVFGQQLGSSLLILGGLLFILGILGGLVYDLGNAILDRLDSQAISEGQQARIVGPAKQPSTTWTPADK